MGSARMEMCSEMEIIAQLQRYRPKNQMHKRVIPIWGGESEELRSLLGRDDDIESMRCLNVYEPK